jgi:hypothetical protein
MHKMRTEIRPMYFSLFGRNQGHRPILQITITLKSKDHLQERIQKSPKQPLKGN